MDVVLRMQLIHISFKFLCLILILALTGKFVNAISTKLRLKMRLGKPFRGFHFQHGALMADESNRFCEQNTIICCIYDPLLLIAMWRVCFKIRSLWTNVWHTWWPRTRNIVPWCEPLPWTNFVHYMSMRCHRGLVNVWTDALDVIKWLLHYMLSISRFSLHLINYICTSLHQWTFYFICKTLFNPKLSQNHARFSAKFLPPNRIDITFLILHMHAVIDVAVTLQQVVKSSYVQVQSSTESTQHTKL